MTRKHLARKHVRAPPCRNTMPTESHSNANLLAISWELYGHCSCCWDMVSPHFLSKPWGYFEGACTCGTCEWSSMRGLWLIVSARWSRLPHRGGRSREVCKLLHAKLWLCYDMKRMIKWCICSTATSWAELEKELKPWCCPWEIVTTLGASPTNWS
jgi:hypothetical protein